MATPTVRIVVARITRFIPPSVTVRLKADPTRVIVYGTHAAPAASRERERAAQRKFALGVGPQRQWKNVRHMRKVVAFVLTVCAVAAAGGFVLAQQKTYPYPSVRDQRGAVPAGPRVGPWNSPLLGDGPFAFDSYEQRGLRAAVVTKGLSHPWSIAFLPDGAILITERQGRLRIVRDGKLDPTPVAGIPAVTSLGTMAGLMDIALHPKFAQNKWIYISYHKPMGTAKSVEGRDAPIASNSILRGTWDGRALTEVRDIFVADDVDMEASRITFGADGMLYMGIGGPGTGSKISMDRA